MNRTSGARVRSLIAFAAMVGCGGNVEIVNPNAPPSGAEGGTSNESGGSGASGSCSPVSAGWACSNPTDDAPHVVMSCPIAIEPSGRCSETTVQTTNPNMPVYISVGTECFACSSVGGTGTDWTCGSSGWKAIGTFSCSP